MSMQEWKCLVAAGLIALATSHNPAYALMIDDFTQGPITLGSEGSNLGGGVSETQTGLDPNHVVAGTRELFVATVTSDSVVTPTTLTIHPDAIDGRLRVTSATVDGDDRPITYFIVRYGSEDTPLNFDATQHGNAIKIHNIRTNFENENLSPLHDMIRVADEDGASAVPFEVPGNDGAFDLILPFSSFDADFENVHYIDFIFARARQRDAFIAFDAISIVPEPGSLALLGLSGITLLWRRRPELRCASRLNRP
ncbi:PEP-CTERM sorting domain-containing protein [Phycisphaerales bacterium AB-hyl4]|uniref:PEP-CTERM sorting domain-containing protein n=1 Tax=Natronomicrosphaera hydrolytica TaxID=3242702 RepID=A0ABV4UAQ3_9BACT